jgi:hypothetical protein
MAYEKQFLEQPNHNSSEEERLEKLVDQLRKQIESNNYELLHLTAWVEKLETWIKSDSVYTLLRYGSKSPTIIDGMDDYYVDLYNTSEMLREKARGK